MLLPNCVVLLGIFCIIFQDANAMPSPAKREAIPTKGQNVKAMQLFPNSGTTKNGFQLWARPEDGDDKKKEEAKGSSDGSDGDDKKNEESNKSEGSGSGDGEKSKGDEAKPTKAGVGAGKELTVSMQSFKVDSMGNNVYNPWGATFGDIWQDTRFNFKGRPTIPRIRIDYAAPSNYYPKNENPSTVCHGRSTVYNRPRVEKWLPRRVATFRYDHRPIWRNLRKAVFDLGKSEECHVPELSDWTSYQLCALRRNQRMEYAIPKYPLHQLHV